MFQKNKYLYPKRERRNIANYKLLLYPAKATFCIPLQILIFSTSLYTKFFGSSHNVIVFCYFCAYLKLIHNGQRTKNCFYTLVKDMWANNADGLEGLIPFYEIKEVFNYIDGRKRRSLKLKSNKACSLESFSMKQDSKDSSILITGLFKSAAYKYRPPYWDTETDEERESPKNKQKEKKKKHILQ